MRLPGFIGPAYKTRGRSVDTCVNLYPEVDELNHSPTGEVAALIGTPGLALRSTAVTRPGRGVYTTTTGRLYRVAGNTVYEVFADYTTMALSTKLQTSVGHLSFADNGLEVMITDGAHGYLINLTTNALVEITDGDFTGFGQVTYQDGYFISRIPGTGRFQLSALLDNSGSWDALDFATAEMLSDNLVGCVSDHSLLWLPGEQSVEIWQNNGSNSMPFDRVPGVSFEYGCANGDTFLQVANTVVWLGAGKGHGVVWSATGYQPTRISDYGVEQALKSYGDLSGASAWTYSDAGHAFYCLNVPDSGTTWVYDAGTGKWHERRSVTAIGAQGRHRATSHAFAFGKHFVDDYFNGNLYTLEDDVYSDAGNPIIAERTCPRMGDGSTVLSYSKFRLDLETGVGLDGSVQGSDPQAMLQYSDDGGRTWSNELWATMGKIGEFSAVCEWNRLGSSTDRAWRVRISDPVKRIINGADVSVVKGR